MISKYFMQVFVDVKLNVLCYTVTPLKMNLTENDVCILRSGLSFVDWMERQRGSVALYTEKYNMCGGDIVDSLNKQNYKLGLIDTGVYQFNVKKGAYFTEEINVNMQYSYITISRVQRIIHPYSLIDFAREDDIPYLRYPEIKLEEYCFSDYATIFIKNSLFYTKTLFKMLTNMQHSWRYM